MVYKCSIPGCRSNYNGEETKYRCFSFPKDESQKKQWLAAIANDDFSLSQHSKVCELHFNETDFEREVSAFDPKKGITITAPLARKRLKKGVVPSLFLPTSTSNSDSSQKKTLPQAKKQLKSSQSATVQNRLKWVPAKNSSLKSTPGTASPSSRLSDNKKEEKIEEMVKRKRKLAADETSSKKTNSTNTHVSNGVEMPEKPEKTQETEKPPVPKPFPLLSVQIKDEPLSDEEAPSNTSQNKSIESIHDNVQITNVRSLPSESIAEIPSDEETTEKKLDEEFDSNFYTKPLDMDQRDKAFGSFVACELSDLRPNLALYAKTKQSILKILTEAHFEQMNCGIKS